MWSHVSQPFLDENCWFLKLAVSYSLLYYETKFIVEYVNTENSQLRARWILLWRFLDPSLSHQDTTFSNRCAAPPYSIIYKRPNSKNNYWFAIPHQMKHLSPMYYPMWWVCLWFVAWFWIRLWTSKYEHFGRYVKMFWFGR